MPSLTPSFKKIIDESLVSRVVPHLEMRTIARIKRLSEIIPSLTSVEAFYSLSDSNSEIKFSICNVLYTSNVGDKLVWIEGETEDKFHETAYICKFAGQMGDSYRSLTLFKSWISDIRQTVVYH